MHAAGDAYRAGMDGHHVAQLNIARLHHPLDAPETAEFDAAIGPINALAEATPGFVWRLVDDDGSSSSHVRLPGEDDPNVIVNMSVWADLAAHAFGVRSEFVMRRRREWFDRSEVAASVCWWIPAGQLPDLADAHRRLQHLRDHGPTEVGWPVNNPVPSGTRHNGVEGAPDPFASRFGEPTSTGTRRKRKTVSRRGR